MRGVFRYISLNNECSRLHSLAQNIQNDVDDWTRASGTNRCNDKRVLPPYIDVVRGIKANMDLIKCVKANIDAVRSNLIHVQHIFHSQQRCSEYDQ